MSKRFVSRKNSKNNILKFLMLIVIIYFILNYFINKVNGTIDDSLISKILLNTYSNKLDYNINLDLNNPEVILSTALNFNDIIKLEKKDDDEATFKENKIHQIYIYNTHQTEEYDAGSLTNYNIDLTVYTASNILKSKLEAYNIDAYVEEKNVKEYLNKYGFNYNQSYKISREFLESLPGVGRKTTNVVLSVLFNEPCMAVDTHIERVSKRLGFADENDSVYMVEQKLYKVIPSNDVFKLHHQLLLFGRYHCKAVKPLCDKCKIYDLCKEKRKM